MPTGKGPLRIAIEDFLEGFGFFERIKKGFDAGGKAAKEGSIGQSWSIILNELGVDGDFPHLLSKNSPAAVLGVGALIPMLLGALIGLGFSFISVLVQPIAMRGQYRVNHRWGAYRIGPRELAQLLKLFPEKSADWIEMLLDLGVNDKSLNGLQALNRQYLNALQYVTLWRRGQLSETELNNKLTQLNILDTDIQRLKQVTEVIPTPNDLILMAVREAFDETFINRFQTAENLPGAFVEWAKKQGLSEEWSRRYWIAHWQLPSPQQVFEMLHRLRPGKTSNPVTKETVNDYLRAADYSPYWRDKLAEISYAPYTRVDVRRMYKTGVLNEAEVKDAYLDLGYDDKHAQALTEFTIAYEAEEETGIVRSSVLQAYGDGMIDRSTAEGMLAGGGYDATTIAFYLDNVDFREGLEVNQIKLSNIKKRFIEGLIDETTVNNEINQLNLPAERVTALLALWLTERENQTALLTITQMEVLLERGIVSSDDFKRIAKRKGYTDEAINWTLTRIAQEASERAQKENETQANTDERIQKSKLSSEYQKRKSAIELSIAQARAEITDIDLALHTELTEQSIIDFRKNKSDISQNIADLDITISEHKAEIVSIDIQLQNEVDPDTAQTLTDRKNELKQAIADLNVTREELQAGLVSVNNLLKGVLTDDVIIELEARKVTLKDSIARLNIEKAQLRFDTQSALNEL